MTTIQQQMSTTLQGHPFGRDPVRQVKPPDQRRQSLPASPLQISTSANQLPLVQNPGPKPGARPTLTQQRAITAPNLTLRTAYAGTTSTKSLPNGSEQGDGPTEPDSSSICHSPTWSRSTSQKQKKPNKEQERERKEQEKRRKEKEKKMKKEERKKASEGARTGKRLSKKPPAAMETQRMAASLTWPPADGGSQSTSRASSRPASRRSSVASISSIMRFSSFLKRKGSESQTESPIEFVDDDPPQLEHPAGLGSNSSIISRGSDSDDAFVKDIKDFAHQVEEPNPEIVGNETPKPDTKKHRSSLAPLSSNPPWKSATNGVPKSPVTLESGPDSVTAEEGQKKDAAHDLLAKSHAEKKDNEGRRSSYSSFAKFLKSEPRKSKTVTESSNTRTEKFQTIPYAKSNSSPNILSDPTGAIINGGNYVRKQKMFQQQRSIADYREQLTVQSANDLLSASNHKWPFRRDDSMNSLPPEALVGSVESLIPRTMKAVDGVAESTKDTPTPEKDGQDAQPMSPIKEAPIQDDLSNPLTPQPLKLSGKGGLVLKPALTSKVLGSHATEAPKPIQSASQPQRPRRLQEGSSFPTEIPVPARSPGRKFNLVHGKDPIAGSNQPEQSEEDSDSRKSSLSLELPKSSTDPALPAFVKKVLDFPSNKKREEPQTTKSTEKMELGRNLDGMRNAQQEGIVESTNGEGSVRQMSFQRPRSDPALDAAIEKVKSPPLDFLPELKHQPLVKPKRTSARVSFKPEDDIVPSSTLHFPSPGSTIDIATPPPITTLQAIPKAGVSTPANTRRQSALRSNRANFGPPQLMQAAQGPAADLPLNAKPIAKLFVICCKCNFWHDLPSRLYEAMAIPQSLNKDDSIVRNAEKLIDKAHSAKTPLERANLLEGKVITAVKCPWCEHGMSTNCCSGWTTIVYLHERHH